MTTATRPFDPGASLDSPDAMLAYLDGAFADGDAGEIADALGVVARARGISQLAEKTGLTRQALYKALCSDGNPEFATVMKVIRALACARLSSPPRAFVRRLRFRIDGHGSAQTGYNWRAVRDEDSHYAYAIAF